MSKPRISIIIPVYNVAPWIDRCVNSLLSQQHDNIEIVLVDDGSTDESGTVCDRLNSDFNNVLVYHQNNHGITRARKEGLRISTGEFIGFVDPDDWVEPEMYSTLLRELLENDTDIVCGGMKRDKNGATYAVWSGSDYEVGFYSGQKLNCLKRSLFDDGKIHISGSMCNKLFKKDLLNTCMEKVDDRLRGIGDDIACVIPYILMSNNVVISDSHGYNGCDREGSATHTKHETFYIQANLTYLRIVDAIRSSGYCDQLEEKFNIVWQRVILDGLKHFFDGRYEYRFDVKQLDLSKQKKLVIYGAGLVGTNYYHQLKGVSNLHIVGWIDRKFTDMTDYEGCIRCSVESVNDLEFDFIIIAMMDKHIAEDIKDTLSDRYGVDEEKIIWDSPKTLYEYGRDLSVFCE